MENTLNYQGISAAPKFSSSPGSKVVKPVVKMEQAPEKFSQRSDSVSLSYTKETSMTYSSSLSLQTGDSQDQYNLLRGLVANILKEQGLDLKISIGEEEVDISSISQTDAAALVADDGYFGVDQTSDRIVDFAKTIAGDDPSRLDVMKEGIQKGFDEALAAFGGTLPDISYETLDAVMNKLDDWAEVDSPEQAS